MSPAELKYWMAAHRKVASLQPDVAAAVLRAFAILRDTLSESELAQAIESGQFDVLVAQVFSEAIMDRAFIPVRQRIRDTVASGLRYTAPSLPKGGKINGVLSVVFDHLSPNVITAVRRLETAVLQSLTIDTREAMRAFVENGIRDGVGPRTIAREIRPIVGMSPTQSENAIKYEAKLVDAGAGNIAKKVAAYQRKAISVNAEAISRTATLDAFKLGQRLAYEDAIAKGIIDRDRLTKTWIGIMDDRERPTHVAMEGNTVPFDAPFKNGQMIPGESEWNCRCLAKYRVA